MSLLSSVLLIDDDSTANFLHQLLLKKMDVAGQILVAEDGQKALDLLATLPMSPNLILLDLNMPVLNGQEFLSRFAHLVLPAPQPKVVILSSSAQALTTIQALGLPVTDRLEKPLTREKLTAVLHEHFVTPE